MPLYVSRMVVHILRTHPGEYYTARQLVETIIETNPEDCKKKNRT